MAETATIDDGDIEVLAGGARIAITITNSTTHWATIFATPAEARKLAACILRGADATEGKR